MADKGVNPLQTKLLRFLISWAEVLVSRLYIWGVGWGGWGYIYIRKRNSLTVPTSQELLFRKSIPSLWVFGSSCSQQTEYTELLACSEAVPVCYWQRCRHHGFLKQKTTGLYWYFWGIGWTFSCNLAPGALVLRIYASIQEQNCRHL